jgi:hypothetical protein
MHGWRRIVRRQATTVRLANREADIFTNGIGEWPSAREIRGQ